MAGVVGRPHRPRSCPRAPEYRRGLQAHAQLRDLCSVHPDPDGVAAHLRDVLANPPTAPCKRHTSVAGPAIVMGVQTSWVAELDGERHLLGQAQQRIVTALADLHRREPGAVLTVAELLEAGWPGEHPIPEAGANRVYVALAQLRRMGLRNVIERREGGYRFVPAAEIKFAR